MRISEVLKELTITMYRYSYLAATCAGKLGPTRREGASKEDEGKKKEEFGVAK